jgi:acetyl esterase/lipase
VPQKEIAMTGLDPVFIQQFGWTDAYAVDTLWVDPELSDRVKASYRADDSYVPPAVHVREILIDGPHGAGSLPLRIYTPNHTAASPAAASAARASATSDAVVSDAVVPDTATSESLISTPVPGLALVWVHGGGFISGGLDMQEADGVAREVCDRAGATVISVGYHLADETVHYPSLHHEVMAAFAWVLDHATDLGVDPARVCLGGASAGANLAAAASLELRDRGARLPHGLVLAYPALHVNIPEPDEQADLSTVPQLLRIPPKVNALMFQTYLGADAVEPDAVEPDAAEPDAAEPDAAEPDAVEPDSVEPGSVEPGSVERDSFEPARVVQARVEPTAGGPSYLSVAGRDLSGLPTALVIAAEYDDLRGSADAYVRQATANEVEVEGYLATGAAHGFLNMTPSVEQTGRVLALMANFVRR